ncbi:MAG TPA: MFS transporter [Candidatus Limnocylindria bacterium]|jgi:AAHS family 4-hydroxybenzoate transporter-like MFS transporter|nr:MFS transporter [Candidatus Limnocylindria bacterium]
MTPSRSVNVSELVDHQKLGGFHLRLVLWSFLIMVTDGFDIGLMAFVAPSLAKVWHIENRAAFAPLFSASFVGILIGSPLFGYIGDRFGRKVAIITGALWYGVFTLAGLFATSLETLIVLRFLAGFGIGGVLPNAIALNAEFAPKRFRATMVILMFTGVTLGGGLPGPIAALLVPTYGWHILFIVGGLIPIVVGLCLIVALPESLKFLALRRADNAAAVRVARRLGPQAEIASDATLTFDEEHKAAISARELFAHGLQWVTPLLWLLFVINLMTFYFLNQWIPLVFADAGLSIKDSALAVTVFQVGGTIGGLVLARPLDRYGFVPVAILFALACPVVASIGFLAHDEGALMTAVFLAGFCLLGLQFGLNASAGLIYPTGVRAFGVGWALGIGRFGSIIGPMVGGALVGAHLPMARLYLYAAIPLIVGTLGAVTLVRLYAHVQRTHGAEPQLRTTTA